MWQWVESRSVVSDSLWPRGLYSPWNSPGQNTGVGSLALLHGDLPNPVIKPRSPELQADSSPAEASVQASSVARSCTTLCDSMDCSRPSLTNSCSLLKLMSIELVVPSNHLILCCPLLFLPSIFPSIRIFSCEFALCIRWPKYWSFSFSISPSNEYSGLISFRIDWFDLLYFIESYAYINMDRVVSTYFMLSWHT